MAGLANRCRSAAAANSTTRSFSRGSASPCQEAAASAARMLSISVSDSRAAGSARSVSKAK
jgi:hypothetical protein